MICNDFTADWRERKRSRGSVSRDLRRKAPFSQCKELDCAGALGYKTGIGRYQEPAAKGSYPRDLARTRMPPIEEAFMATKSTPPLIERSRAPSPQITERESGLPSDARRSFLRQGIAMAGGAAAAASLA